MPNIIKNKKVINDDWSILRLKDTNQPNNIIIPSNKKVIVPLSVWQLQHTVLKKRSQIGVWLASHERFEVIQQDLTLFDVIAIDFPKFNDGRGYSIAYKLRTHYGYVKELRAIGDILRDQLFYLCRVGFNAFEVRSDKNIYDALKSFNDFSEKYQSSSDEKDPLFRRVKRKIHLTKV